MAKVIEEIVTNQKIDMKADANVYIGRDTRPSSQALSQAVLDGVQAAGGQAKDFGVVSTPQLHYFVVCQNTNGAYGVPTIQGYYDKLSKAFKEFKTLAGSSKDPEKDVLDFDGANGVGATSMQGFLGLLNANEQVLQVNIFNGNVDNGQALNAGCGADFVKVQQKSPENFQSQNLRRCVSFDGDADRVIYFFTDDSGTFRLLDGDKIATLSKFYYK